MAKVTLLITLSFSNMTGYSSWGCYTAFS